jgi:drug/metabolite transporter (DMT)-like permease
MGSGELVERITFTSQTTRGVAMSITRWNRLKKRIRKCKREMNWWSGFAWTLLGVFIPSAVQAIQDNKQTWNLTLWSLLAIVSFLASAVCFFGYAQAARQESDSLESVLEEMEEIEVAFADTKDAVTKTA